MALRVDVSPAETSDIMHSPTEYCWSYSSPSERPEKTLKTPQSPPTESSNVQTESHANMQTESHAFLRKSASARPATAHPRSRDASSSSASKLSPLHISMSDETSMADYMSNRPSSAPSRHMAHNSQPKDHHSHPTDHHSHPHGNVFEDDEILGVVESRPSHPHATFHRSETDPNLSTRALDHTGGSFDVFGSFGSEDRVPELFQSERPSSAPSKHVDETEIVKIGSNRGTNMEEGIVSAHSPEKPIVCSKIVQTTSPASEMASRYVRHTANNQRINSKE